MFAKTMHCSFARMSMSMSPLCKVLTKPLAVPKSWIFLVVRPVRSTLQEASNAGVPSSVLKLATQLPMGHNNRQAFKKALVIPVRNPPQK